MSVFDGVDTSDPCQMWPVLQDVLDKLLAGEMSVRGRFGDDEQEWQRTDIGALRQRIRELKHDCAVKQGVVTGRRRAISFG